MPSTAASAAVAAASSHQQQPQQQPSFMPTFMPQQNNDHQPEKSYSSEPTPVILSSAPKLYNNRPMSIQPNEYPFVHQAPQVGTSNKLITFKIDLLINIYFTIFTQIDITSIQFDVTQKLKKLKAEKSGPNPIAEAAIQAAKASSALQNFQINEKRKKDKKVRMCAISVKFWADFQF